MWGVHRKWTYRVQTKQKNSLLAAMHAHDAYCFCFRLGVVFRWFTQHLDDVMSAGNSPLQQICCATEQHWVAWSCLRQWHSTTRWEIHMCMSVLRLCMSLICIAVHLSDVIRLVSSCTLLATCWEMKWLHCMLLLHSAMEFKQCVFSMCIQIQNILLFGVHAGIIWFL